MVSDGAGASHGVWGAPTKPVQESRLALCWLLHCRHSAEHQDAIQAIAQLVMPQAVKSAKQVPQLVLTAVFALRHLVKASVSTRDMMDQLCMKHSYVARPREPLPLPPGSLDRIAWSFSEQEPPLDAGVKASLSEAWPNCSMACFSGAFAKLLALRALI